MLIRKRGFFINTFIVKIVYLFVKKAMYEKEIAPVSEMIWLKKVSGSCWLIQLF